MKSGANANRLTGKKDLNNLKKQTVWKRNKCKKQNQFHLTDRLSTSKF